MVRPDQEEEQKGDQFQVPPGMVNSNSSAKKEANSIARYIDVSPYTYEFPWQSTFMHYITHSECLFVRGKYNSMDVVAVDDLSYIKSIDTSGCGVFSAIQGTGQ
jgi:hypothetical protein